MTKSNHYCHPFVLGIKPSPGQNLLCSRDFVNHYSDK